MPIVDAHPHVIAADRVRYPLVPTGGKPAVWVVDRGLPVEGFIGQLDAAGVDLAVLVQASMAHGIDNRYTGDSADAYPQRFAAVGALELHADDVCDRFDYWVGARGFVGMRSFLTAPNLGPDADAILLDPHTAPLWTRASELGIPIKLQLSAPMLPRVRALAERYPTLDLIVDHFAKVPLDDGPPFDAAGDLWALARCPCVYLLLSDHVIHDASAGSSTPRAFLERAVGTFGADRILWGSNFPSSPGSVTELLGIAQQALAFLPESDRAAIFGSTALRIYPRLG